LPGSLLDGHECHINIALSERPARMGQLSDDLNLELLMKHESFAVVLEVIGKHGKGELCRTAACVPPLKSGRAVTAQIEP